MSSSPADRQSRLGVFRSVLVLVLASSALTPASADVFRLGVSRIDSQFALSQHREWITNGGHGLIASHDLSVEVNSSDLEMPTLSWERRLRGPWAIAASVGTGEIDLDYDLQLVTVDFYPPDQPPTTTEFRESAEFASTRITLALIDLRYHLVERPRLDLYAGATVGRVFTSQPRVQFAFSGADIGFDTVEVDDAFAYGVHLGADIPIGSRGLALALLVRGLRADLGVSAFGQTRDLELGALSTEWGLGLRF